MKKGEENKENKVEDEQEEEDGDNEIADQMPASNADPEYKKRVKWGMRNWIDGTDCWKTVSNKYFNNPRHQCHDEGVYVLSISTIFLLMKLKSSVPDTTATFAYSRKSS